MPSPHRFVPIRTGYWVLGAALALLSVANAEGVVPRKPVKIISAAAEPPTAEKKEPTSARGESGPAARVEVFIPSTERLGHATAKSHLAAIFDAVSGAIQLPNNESGEQFDLAALYKVVTEIRSWPETSLAAAIFMQDSEGRPRWVLRTDWPIEQLARRVQGLLDLETSRKILANVQLRKREDGTFSLELPEMQLAVLRADGSGSIIGSSETVELPEKLYGRKAAGASNDSDTPSLVFCRVNLAAADDEGQSSVLSSLLGIRSLRYTGGLTASGDWTERISFNWNPAIGIFIKGSVKRVKKQFDCPADAYLVAAVHVDMGGGLADGIADLPNGTTGQSTYGEMAVTVAPGDGFFPVPDLYYQFALKSEKKVIDAIRKFIDEDRDTRAEDDLEPAWHEIKSGERPIFWRDPSSDGGSGMAFANFRTVIFFQPGDPERKTEDRMIVAETTSFAEEAVAQWRKLCRRQTVRLPDGADAHWQARISWRRIYAQIEPYLGLATAFGEDTRPLPSAESLNDALSDSTINIRIETSGVRVTHLGPIPLGMFLVPTVVAEAIMSRGSASSESERERLACRNLRVLYHHAKLFNKDYGRWPATVAELDGYVDFNEHRHLLWLPERDRGLIAGIVSTAVGGRAYPEADREKVDDAIYEIEWTPTEWQLRFRDGEFRDYKTIAIDADGEIHRVPKDKTKNKIVGVGSPAAANER